MSLRLPLACVLILLLAAAGVALRQFLPERIVAELHSDNVIAVEGREMDRAKAMEWLTKRANQNRSGRWMDRKVVLETHALDSVDCEDAHGWFCAIASIGIPEFRIAFDHGRKECRFFPQGLPYLFDDWGLMNDDFGLYRADDLSVIRKDGTSVRFRWIGVRREGVMVNGRLLSGDGLQSSLRPSPDDRFIFVCDPGAPFAPVPLIQHRIEQAGCRPSIFVLSQ